MSFAVLTRRGSSRLGTREVAAHFAGRLGIFLQRATRSIRLDFMEPPGAEATELVRRVKERFVAHRFVLTSPRARTCRSLRAAYPSDLVLPSPYALARARFHTQLHPEALIAFRGPRDVAPGSDPSIAGATLVVRADELRPPGRIDGMLEHLVARLGPTTRVAAGERGGRLPTRLASITTSRAGARLAALRRERRLDSIEALREHLSRPEAVLCVGNGPTSDLPELDAIAHDCLMRVNWRWRDRGYLTRPQLVFVGDPHSVARLEGCAFAFRNLAWESEVMLRDLGRLGRRRLTTFVTEGVVAAIDPEAQLGARPTNGALMIATAAALAPARLIIAGIDLYAHPAGRYPGDPIGENDYAQVHDREVELAIIRAALDAFRGEVEILSPILRECLARARRLAPAAQAARPAAPRGAPIVAA